MGKELTVEELIKVLQKLEHQDLPIGIAGSQGEAGVVCVIFHDKDYCSYLNFDRYEIFDY